MAVVTIVASAARTTSGSSAAIKTPQRVAESCAIHVDVTAASGVSPNLALTVEWSNDGTAWVKGEPADSFTAITAANTAAKVVALKGRYFRLVWTLTGTAPSFTFSSSLWVA